MLLASESRWLGSEWGERGLCRSSCRAGTSCPAKKKRCRHRPQHQMALSPPVPGSDAGLGCSLRCWQPRGGVSHPPAGCSIRGEGCVHGAALHSSFGSVMMLEGGVTGRCGAGEAKQECGCPRSWGRASLLPSPTASPGGRCRLGSCLSKDAGGSASHQEPS